MSVIDQMVQGNWPTTDDPTYESMLVSFGESDSGSINIPGFPPFPTGPSDAIGALYQLSQIIAALTAEVSYIPVINVILFILDIVLALLPLFAGRPRQEATLNCAQNLLKAKNSAAILAGTQILRIFQQWDIVISESGPGETIVAAIVAQMVNNLTGQGISLSRARGIVLYQFQQGADNPGVIAPALQNAVATGTPIYGPQGFERIYENLIKDYLAKGQTEEQAEEHALRDMLRYAPLRWIKHIYIGHQPTDPPPGVCPIHQHWDFTINGGAGGCVPDQVVPPPPPPPWTPPPGTPPVSTPDPQGDEITRDLCQQLADNTTALLYGLDQVRQAVSGSTDPTCCATIATAINSITTAINAVVAALPASAGAPAITFAPNITIDVPPPPPPTITVNEAPFDQANLERIAKANETMALQGDVPLPILRQLFESGIIPESMSNLLQGSPWSEVLAAIEAWKDKVSHATWWQDISYGLRLLAKLNAGDPGTFPTPSLDDPPLGGPDAATALAAGTKDLLEWGFNHFDTIASPFVKGILDAHATELRGMRDVKPGDEIGTATRLMTEASSFGIGAHFAAVLGEMIYPSKTLGFPQLAATLALFSGYDELIKGYIGSEVRAVITAPHTYATNSRARSYLPGAREALTLSARRKLHDTDLAQLLDFNGISPTYRAAEDAGKYRPLSARALATLVQDTPFNRAQMQEILEDNAFSPDHVQTMLDLLEYNSTKNVRNSLISQAETAYKQGVIGDDEMHQIVIDAGWSDAAWQLVNSKILIERRMTLASEVEKQVIPLVANGNITADQALQQLEAAGVQDWYAQLVITLATTKAEIHATKLEAAAQAKLERQRQSNLTRAAISEFQRGAIDAAGLALALAAIPVDPTIAASIVAVQDATRAGKLRFVFGQFLTPEDARVLTDRVAAIEGQFKKQLISRDQTETELNSLNLPSDQVAALLARWAAALTATGKNAYLLSPLTGKPPT